MKKDNNQVASDMYGNRPLEFTADISGISAAEGKKKRSFNIKDGGWAYSIAAVVLIIISMVTAFAIPDFTDSNAAFWKSALSLIAIQLALIAIFYFFIKARKISFKETRIFGKLTLKNAGKTFVVVTALWGPFLLITAGVSLFLEAIGYKFGGIGATSANWHSIVLLPIISILPAIGEELVLRGTVLPSLEKSGKYKAIFLSAAMFALMHMTIAQTVTQFILGAVIAYLVIAYRSIWVGVLAHFLNNFYASLMSVGAVYVFDGDVLIVLIVLSVMCIIAVVVYNIVKAVKRNINKAQQSDVVYGSEPHGATELAVKSKGKKFGIIASYFGVLIFAAFWIIDLVTNIMG